MKRSLVLLALTSCEPLPPKARPEDFIDASTNVKPLEPPALWISCLTAFSCSEVSGHEELVKRARERCEKAGSEARAGRCSTDGVLGECVLPEIGLTIFTYKSDDPDETKRRADTAPSSCAQNGGKYSRTK